MNRQDIISMAREAGYFLYDLTETHGIKTVETDEDDQWAQLERFAELVRKDYSFTHANIWLDRIHKAMLEEREACAKLCDEARAARLAEQIRSRGDK